MELTLGEVTQTTASFIGRIDPAKAVEEVQFGILCSTNQDISISRYDKKIVVTSADAEGNYSAKFTNLKFATTYNYVYYIRNNGIYSYSEVNTFTTEDIPVTVSVSSVTQTTATFAGRVDFTEPGVIEVGILYSESETFTVSTSGVKQFVLDDYINQDGDFSYTEPGLINGTGYNYRYYLKQGTQYTYSDVQSFFTQEVPVAISVQSVTQTTATFAGRVDFTEPGVIEVGILCSESETFTVSTSGVKQFVLDDYINQDGDFSYTEPGLINGTGYNYRYYVKQGTQYTYSDVQSFFTQDVPVTVSVSSVTQTTAIFAGKVDFTEPDVIEVGILYSESETFTFSTSGVGKIILDGYINPDGDFNYIESGLINGSKYNYRYYVKQGTKYTYSDIQSFATQEVHVAISVQSVTHTTATFVSEIDLTEQELIEVGLLVSGNSASLKIGNESVHQFVLVDVNGNNNDEVVVERLQPGKKYYSYYIKQGSDVKYSAEVSEFTTLIPDISSGYDLSADESANCYIVSSSGQYKFKTVKGNGSESIVNGFYADVLWESFGTSVAPMKSELVSWVYFADGYLNFEIPSDYKEGNAVIAVKDASGKILWSWHIWLTDRPESQTYYVYDYDTDSFTKEVAGIMMDRNLGATSATKGDVGALGLLYQWGRKDPFLGSSSISNSNATEAKSTIEWPSSVKSTSETGTIEYAVSHPTTFIYGSKNYDWYYTGNTTTDNTRWTTSESEKSVYDPCPAGWRVPDGGGEGIWEKSGFISMEYDDTKEGIYSINSNLKLWYPAAGYRDYGGGGGSLDAVGYNGYYWSATPRGSNAYRLIFYDDGDVDPSNYDSREEGNSVRCLQE